MCVVLYLPAGLSPSDHARALATAPELVESDADRPTLLERRDLAGAFTQSCRERPGLEAEWPAGPEARLDEFRRRIRGARAGLPRPGSGLAPEQRETVVLDCET